MIDVWWEGNVSVRFLAEQLAVISENGVDSPVSTYRIQAQAMRRSVGKYDRSYLDVPIGLPKVNRTLGIQPELGAIAE
jgi:hypothetical protein